MTVVRQESNVFTLARRRAGEGRASLRLPAVRLYRAHVDLLERDDVLATLVEARAAAARGDGRVVLVSGEPGIGKSAVVDRFVRELGPETHVLVGTCDDLSTPRPLAPLREFAGSVSPRLAEALSAGDVHEIHTRLLAELESSLRPTVVVLEDVHWADDATLDAITFLGRRIAMVPAVLVLTYRTGEVGPGHPFHAAVGSIPTADSVFVELAPLSRAAVDSLFGRDGREVYRQTRGNPFYVTELLATDTGFELPPSVAAGVVGRAARLEESSRRLLELISVVPARVGTALLDRLLPGWAAAAEEPERKHLLEVAPGFVRFRHELARQAIAASLPLAARRRHHEAFLGVLLETGADAADIVHHAERAGRRDVVSEHAVVAGRDAATLESHREAYAQYRRAADLVDLLPPEEQGVVLAEFAAAAYVLGRVDEAIPAVEQAIEIHTRRGQTEAAGRCTRMLSRLQWFAGHGAEALQHACDAIDILEPLGPSIELARAYGARSQIAMLAEDADGALRWGGKELELAERLGDACTRAHALVTIASVRVQGDPDDTEPLIEAHAAADEAGDAEEATRALSNLGFSLLFWMRPEPARVHLEHALEYARAHERENLASYAATTLAWLRLRAGEWAEAERIVRSQETTGATVPQLVAATVLVELAVRRGDADATARLSALAAQADRAGDLQRTLPVFELEVERAVTGGGELPHLRLERLAAEIRSHSARRHWGSARLAAWAAVAGIDLDLGLDASFGEPFAAMIERDWQKAADAYGRAGWTYDQALMLSLLDEPDALAQALETARALGAAPLARRVTSRMRKRGFTVPRGPRVSTRRNPVGLTARQLEVLALLLDGLTNGEIAHRLIVSPRTAEHHVAAVLGKLGAASRKDAKRRASELGVEVGVN